MLLTSIAFAVAAVALARRQVLVQELPAVEGLARVDVVLLDKTGTITDGEIVFSAVEPLADDDPIEDVLGALASDENRNATINALAEKFSAPQGWSRTSATPFSSARKWSAAGFDGHGTWVLGAPEMVLADAYGGALRDDVDREADAVVRQHEAGERDRRRGVEASARRGHAVSFGRACDRHVLRRLVEPWLGARGCCRWRRLCLRPS